MGKKTQGGATPRGQQHRLWVRWRGMMARCHYEWHNNFQHYGGRGITVCERWRYFLNFVEDMNASFFEKATIERIDNNKGYSPENCRWATRAEQSKNRRANRFMDTPWGRMTLLEASRKVGIRHATLRERIERGWPQEKWFVPGGSEARGKNLGPSGEEGNLNP
jgi:hypothetical protein